MRPAVDRQPGSPREMTLPPRCASLQVITLFLALMVRKRLLEKMRILEARNPTTFRMLGNHQKQSQTTSDHFTEHLITFNYAQQSVLVLLVARGRRSNMGPCGEGLVKKVLIRRHVGIQRVKRQESQKKLSSHLILARENYLRLRIL